MLIINSVCIISILRLHSLQVITHSLDPSYDNAPVAAFSVVETYVALICACLPTLRPLLSQWFSGLSSSAHASSNPYTNATGGGGSLHVEEMLRSRDTKKSRRRSSLPFGKGMPLQGMPGGKRGVERLGDDGWTRADEVERQEREGTIIVETRVDVTVGEREGRGKGAPLRINERESSTESLFTDTKYVG